MALLDKKVAILTGAAKGIGKAAAVTFAKNGAKAVIIVDIDIQKAKETAKEIKEKYNCDCIGLEADVSNEKDVEDIFSTVLKKYGTIDILVNNAGICRIIDINDITMEQWDLTMNINLKGTFLFSRKALNIMKQNKYGKIINVASQAGRTGGIMVGPDYPSSKAGIICLTKTLAKNYSKYNININSVAPGLINTEMTKTFGYDPEVVPLKRIGTPEEVADVILFLASDLSRYIAGACIDVNGGILMV